MVYLDGRGPPARLTGLTRSMFRPSDDGVTFPYNIPGNAMACSELTHLITLLQDISAKTAAAPGAPINTDIEALMKSAKTTKASICNALKKLEESVSESSKPVFPYEMDGYGNRYYMDDANIPSLLSLPVLGYMSKENLLYASTRAFLLSNENPYYFNGSEAFGIGGPHVGYNYTWPMSIITIAMTSDDDEEILKCLEMLKKSAASTGFMHESFNVNDVNDYTRSWFAWANGLFGELLLQLIDTKPYLIIKADYIALAQTYVKTPVCVEAQLNALV